MGTYRALVGIWMWTGIWLAIGIVVERFSKSHEKHLPLDVGRATADEEAELTSPRKKGAAAGGV
jgi:hypothetical protein